ncbi:MAG: putative hydro-lyase [Thermodesulfobacteriota bacterium]
MSGLSPVEFRSMVRRGSWSRPTAGCCPGHTQANLVILPARYAFHFLLFCQRNPKACPVLEVVDEGLWEPARTAPGADIRTDCPKYRVFRGKEVEERPHIVDLWRDDLVSFLLGCSFTFEWALAAAGVPVRHIEEGRNVPMYVTNVPCEPAGPFRGNLVVTMRPIPGHLVSRAVQVTSRFPGVHGAPVHVGDPCYLGVRDLSKPDFGDAVTMRPGEVPVFWACGVTPQVALLNADLELAITHAPGHMFVTDMREEQLAVF